MNLISIRYALFSGKKRKLMRKKREENKGKKKTILKFRQ